jgi:hypothetical protein
MKAAKPADLVANPIVESAVSFCSSSYAEDGRMVARPEVAPLLLVGCRVVNLEEAFKDGRVAYNREIKDDLDCLRVPLRKSRRAVGGFPGLSRNEAVRLKTSRSGRESSSWLK